MVLLGKNNFRKLFNIYKLEFGNDTHIFNDNFKYDPVSLKPHNKRRNRTRFYRRIEG